MTMMNEGEMHQNACHNMEPNIQENNRYVIPDVVHSTMHGTTMSQINPCFSDFSGALMKDGHHGKDRNFLDATSLSAYHNGNLNGSAEDNKIIDLCEHLNSVEMGDVQPCRESFHDMIPERPQANEQMKEHFDYTKVYTKDRDGDTLLHTAIILRELSLVMLFISKASTNAWLSFKNLLFQTPLHLAIITNQPEITRRLVVAGAEIDARDKDGNTALHIACREGQQRNVQNLLEPVRYHETKQNTYEIPYQPIPQDFSIMNYEGLTCLQLAATNGHLAVVETLLDKDIDVNLKEGKTGRTILHNACLSGDINLVKLLLRHRDCNINARAFDNSTPFDLARDRGHDIVCMVLAAAGARYGEEFSDSD